MTKYHKQIEISKCLRKITYYSAIDADLKLAELWAEIKRDGSKYKCPWCAFYHLTKRTWNVKTA